MEKRQGRSQFEDVSVELIHCIQSLLPIKEATRTCVLSKTWLHAWSTIPHLRFHETSEFPNEEKQRDYIQFMDRTMSKYVQDNIPIESFDLKLHIKWASLVNKWIQTVATQSCLKELSLEICDVVKSKYSYIFPNEIFSGENLHTLLLKVLSPSPWFSFISMSRNPVIKCVSLRVLELEHVKISEEVLDALISTCILLEKISISYSYGLKTIKVTNLCYLQELKIISSGKFDVPYDTIVIFDDVPNLRLFSYIAPWNLFFSKPMKTFNMASLTSVTELSLHGFIIDVAFLDMIKSNFHYLEILNITILNWPLEMLDLTSFSLKRLNLIIHEERRIDIQVYAPKLLHLSYTCDTMPSLLFPSTNAPEYIKLTLSLWNLNYHSFFLKMREVLNLSSKFDIKLKYMGREPPNIDNEERELGFPIPSANVQQLSYYADSHKFLQGQLSFFDALVTICHPKYITIDSKKICSLEECYRVFFKPMISGMMEKKTSDRIVTEFKNPVNGKWEILRDPCTSIIGRSDDFKCFSLELKPNW